MKLFEFFKDESLKFDVEYGNSHYFYSASKAYHNTYQSQIKDGCTVNHSWQGELVSSDVTLNDEVTFDRECMLRALSFTMCGTSNLFDFVSRFVVYSDDARPGYIDGKEFIHNSTNLYRQYPVRNGVKVPCGNGHYLHFESISAIVPNVFDEVFYIRDEGVDAQGYRWIVHHRLIVNPEKVKLVLRSCNPRFEGPLPGERYLPKWLKKPFFRIREDRYPNFPIMTVGEAELNQGTLAILKTKVSFADV